MSSIIDALKKSDANRPQKNHGMKMNLNLSNPTADKRRYIMPLAVFLIVLMVAASWYLKKPSFIWQTADSAIATVKAPAIKPNNTPTKLAKPEPAQVQSKAQQPREKDNPVQDNNSSVTSSQANISQGDLTDDSIKAAALTNTKSPLESANTTTQQPPNSAVIADTQTIDEQLSETPMKNKQAINKPVTDAKENTEIAVPQLFELPYAIRKDLPKLSLSVHIYDPIIENRMAILNGLSIHVGDTFEELLTIKNITQEGVVLTI